MNEMQIFQYQDKPVRTIQKDGEPWWVLKDVCKVLEMDTTQLKKVADRLEPDEKGRNLIPTPGGNQETMSAVRLNKLLHDMKIQYKSGKCWVLYQDYADKGYTKSNTYSIDEDNCVIHTYWTQSGRLFLYNLLKEKCGILPIVEK